MMWEFDLEMDGVGTLAFCYEENKWRGSDSYESDGLAHTPSDLYSFKNGELWKHNIPADERNLIYNLPVSSVITVVANAEGSKEKTWLTVSVEGNIPPIASFWVTTGTRVQGSSLKAAWFKRRGAVFYSDIKRDVNSSGGIHSGERLRGPYMYCVFQWNTYNRLEVRAFNIGYKISAGNEFV